VNQTLSRAQKEFADSLSAGLLKTTGQDFSETVNQLVDEEVRLLVGAAMRIHDPEAMKPMMNAILMHRERVAKFFGSALKNGKFEHATRNMWTKFWNAWLQILSAKSFVTYNRTKLAKFFRDNLGVEVPVLGLQAEVEKLIFGQKPASGAEPLKPPAKTALESAPRPATEQKPQ